MKAGDQVNEAMKCLGRGHALQALRIADELTASEDEVVVISGHICKGLIYEYGGDEVPVDLERAMQHYRRVALVVRDATTYCDMARATLKQGPSHSGQALKYLQEARSLQDSPEVDLGFAEYFKSRPDPDYPRSRGFFLRAALHGRFMGFFGYAEVSRIMGQNGRALAADCVRLLLGPFIALLIGSKATGRF